MSFCLKMNKLFDVSNPDFIRIIRSTRDKETAEEDIEWLTRLKAGERLTMAGKDTLHEARVKRKEIQMEKANKLIEKEEK